MLGQIGQDLQTLSEEIQHTIQSQFDSIVALSIAFLSQTITPEATCTFETGLKERLDEIGRRVLECTLNRLEPETAAEMSKTVELDGQEYSRKNRKTRNRNGIGTVFGKIELYRFSYEPLSEARMDGHQSFAPLELALGIVAGNATPALAESVGRAAAEFSQGKLLEFLQRTHHLSWSPKVLRQVTAAISAGIAEQLHELQKELLLEWLRQADASKGRRKITLVVGRDGIMLPIRDESSYKEGAVGTVTVYDRSGHRLGTVYLGQLPESHQTILSTALTRLVTEVLSEWRGNWPRLAFITDAGFHPTDYFDTVLSQLDDPRHPGRVLHWIRVVDFYHACSYLAKFAQVLFDDPRAAHAWQKRMRRLLKEDTNAVYRIQHAAARLHSERVLTKSQEEIYWSAYGYFSNQKAYMDYRTYRRFGLPIGSGVTEAACKTVFTQRFKQSGMVWGIEGATVILTLRLATLSKVWDRAYRGYLASRPLAKIRTKPGFAHPQYAKAA